VKRYGLFLETCRELQRRGWTVVTSTLGQLRPEDVWRRMNEAHLVLVTSRREAGPLVAKEAVAIGVPVVAVDVGDLVSWLPRRAIALAEPQALADAVESVLASEGSDFQIPAWADANSVADRLRKFLSSMVEAHSRALPQ
jgi:glycosyltransferase involved in cell wall biosynthesis